MRHYICGMPNFDNAQHFAILIQGTHCHSLTFKPFLVSLRAPAASDSLALKAFINFIITYIGPVTCFFMLIVGQFYWTEGKCDCVSSAL